MLQPDAPAAEQASWGKPAMGAQAVDQPGGEVWPVDPVPQVCGPSSDSRRA